MLFPTLLVLTMTVDGGVRVTLSEAETLEDCTASLDVVTQILVEGGVDVVHAICGETALRLTPFEHGATAEDEKHLYRVELTSDAFTVAPLAEGEACNAAPEASPAVYCTRSAQSVVN